MPKNSNNGSQPPPIDADTLKGLVSNQTRELIIREKELELERQKTQKELDVKHSENKMQVELANKDIDAQKEVVKESLNNSNQANKRSNLLAAFTIFVVITFFLFSMYMGKEDFAKQVFQIAVAGILGYIAGHGKGKEKGKANNSKN